MITTKSVSGFTEAFRQAISRTGIEPPADIIADGRIRRFHISGDKPRTESGWYVLHDDDPAAGAFGCWKRGISETWCAREYRHLTTEEKVHYKVRMDAIREQREEEQARIYAECRKASEDLWDKAREASGDHPYILAKGIKPAGIRQLGDMLLIPLQDYAGTLHGLQFIGPDGGKRYKTGTNKTEHFFLLPGDPSEPLLICEGYATGASLHETTGYSVAVTFDAGNIEAVAKVIRGKMPERTLIVCADNDQWTEGNPGIRKATAAARETGALLATPAFQNTSMKPTDFNDLHRLEGPEAVRRCIESASRQVPDATQQDEGWAVPVLFGEITAPEIPCSILPAWLGEYAQAVSENTQTPPGMSVMMALSTIAACAQKRFKVARTPEHVEPLSLWTAAALPPASRKTAVVNACTDPLAAWEREQAEVMRQRRFQIEAERETIESRIKKLQTDSAKISDDAERRNMAVDIAKLKSDMPEQLHSPVLFTGDSTPERLQSLLAEQGERMAVLSDEGGIFAVMAGLYSAGRANIDVFLKGHAGSAVRVDRQGRTVYLNEPALTFGLCIQPDIIRQLSKTTFRGNGCLARFLFCLPQNNIGTRTPHSRPIPESVKAAYQAGIHRLLNIPPIYDEHGKETARILTLDPEATEAWEAFFAFIESSIGEGQELEPIQDWAGKLPGAALRIAGIMAIVEQGEAARTIPAGLMENALNLCELLIPHAQAAFDLIDGDDSQHDAKHILKWMLSKGKPTFGKSDIYRELRRFNDGDRLGKALQVLANRHIISDPIAATAGARGGRPSITYQVNPAIFRKDTCVMNV